MPSYERPRYSPDRARRRQAWLRFYAAAGMARDRAQHFARKKARAGKEAPE